MYIKDLQSGKVRKYGTDCHDSLRISSDGRTLTYYNLQNGDGSGCGEYRFCDENGNLPCDIPFSEGYFNIGGFDEIVRCKDCKYCDRGIDEDGNPFLKCLGWVYGGTQEEDFCSHAERRTDG